jgi:ComF family protein
MSLLMLHLVPHDVDAVVPVPLHRGRERSRGYNQAAALAKHLAQRMDIAYEGGASRRIRPTAPLARTMHRDERRAIVAGAFTARHERVEGRGILLVDDVATTGATLDSCAAALLDAGARSVSCITWARAD